MALFTFFCLMNLNGPDVHAWRIYRTVLSSHSCFRLRMRMYVTHSRGVVKINDK